MPKLNFTFGSINPFAVKTVSQFQNKADQFQQQREMSGKPHLTSQSVPLPKPNVLAASSSTVQPKKNVLYRIKDRFWSPKNNALSKKEKRIVPAVTPALLTNSQPELPRNINYNGTHDSFGDVSTVIKEKSKISPPLHHSQAHIKNATSTLLPSDRLTADNTYAVASSLANDSASTYKAMDDRYKLEVNIQNKSHMVTNSVAPMSFPLSSATEGSYDCAYNIIKANGTDRTCKPHTFAIKQELENVLTNNMNILETKEMDFNDTTQFNVQSVSASESDYRYSNTGASSSVNNSTFRYVPVDSTKNMEVDVKYAQQHNDYSISIERNNAKTSGSTANVSNDSIAKFVIGVDNNNKPSHRKNRDKSSHSVNSSALNDFTELKRCLTDVDELSANRKKYDVQSTLDRLQPHVSSLLAEDSDDFRDISAAFFSSLNSSVHIVGVNSCVLL